MRSLISCLIITLIAYYAGLYGSYWDSQANPSMNVTLFLSNGDSYTGFLSRSFEGDYILSTENDRFVVPEASVQGVFWRSGNSLGWRAWLPPLTILGVWLFLHLMALSRLLARIQKADAEKMGS